MRCGLLIVAWAGLLAGCSVEVDKLGLLCSEAEPCSEGLSCIDGRCARARTMELGTALPPGRRGRVYRGDVPVTGGTPPYRVTVESTGAAGFLLTADGATLTSDRELSEGRYTISVRVSDSAPSPETLSADLRLDITGLPELDAVAAVTPAPTAGSTDLLGDYIVLADGSAAASVLRLTQDAATGMVTPQVVVLLGEPGGAVETLVVTQSELELAVPAPSQPTPFALPRIVEAGTALYVGYLLVNDDSSHSMGVTRIDRAGGTQVHGSFDLNSGTGYALALAVIGDLVYAGTVAVSISADLVFATLDAAELTERARRALPYTAVRGGEATGLELVEVAGRPWYFAASDLGGEVRELNDDLTEGAGGFDVGTPDLTDVRVVVLGNTLVHAWSRGLSSATVDVYRTPVSSQMPGAATAALSYGISELGLRTHGFALFSDGTEVMIAALDAAAGFAPRAALGSATTGAFESLSLDLGTSPDSTAGAARDTPGVVRGADLGYHLVWSEETDADAGTRRLYGLTTRDPVPPP